MIMRIINIFTSIHEFILMYQKWRRSAAFIINFEHILHLFSSVCVGDLVNVSWVAVGDTLLILLYISSQYKKCKIA